MVTSRGKLLTKFPLCGGERTEIMENFFDDFCEETGEHLFPMPTGPFWVMSRDDEEEEEEEE